MSNVVSVFARFGQLIGKLVEEDLETGAVTIEDPVIVQPGSQHVSLIPLLAVVEEKTITLAQEDLEIAGLFTPQVPVRNHYSNMFGSGIQVPDNSIIA